MSSNNYDIAIIGAGMAGLSAAYALRNSGKKIIILEQATPAHAKGSSHGQTRMYREMYSDPFLCEVSKLSNKLWREQEREAGIQLRREHGLLFYGEDWGTETIEGSIGGAKKVMLDQGIPFEEQTSTQIEARWPLKTKTDWWGLFEPTAGAILSDRAIDYWISSIESAGHTIVSHTQVADIKNDADGVTLSLSGNEMLRVDQVIVATGAWTTQLLGKDDYSPKFSIWQMLWAHYRVEKSLADQYPQWFCFQQKDANDIDQGLYYGFPCVSSTKDGDPLIKVGLDFTLPQLKSDNYVEPTQAPEELLNLLDGFVSQFLTGVIDRYDTWLSPYTMSPDVQFTLDRINDRITVFSHGSGQAFKFAPVIGESLKRLVLNEKPLVDLSAWALKREALASV